MNKLGPEAMKEFEKILNQYIRSIRKDLNKRISTWTVDLSKPEICEVIGGLLARQVSLAVGIASAPQIWNPHIALILLRSMIDVYINLAWIFMDLPDRSQKFILYGLGQQKLQNEHRKTLLKELGKDPKADPLVKHNEVWLSSQRFEFLTEVNVGSWAGKSTRDMAIEAKCQEIYQFAYDPFSAATHSTWNHIERMNLKSCNNPLHRYHRIPVDLPLATDYTYLELATKYLAKTFNLFDEKTGIQCCPSNSDEKLFARMFKRTSTKKMSRYERGRNPE